MNRDRRLRRERVWAVALGLIVIGGAAQAQTPGEVGKPAPTGPDTGTYTPRQIGNYDPKGMPVGSFRLFPDLELDEVFNDNIYATPSSQSPTAAFVQMIRPTLDLRSDWNSHMLNLFAKGAFGFYSSNSAQDYQDL